MTSWAVVTGASSGIGLEIAKLLAADRFNIVLVARREDRLRKLASELEKQYSVKAECIAVDLVNPLASKMIFEFTREKGLTVEILVNNAGFGAWGTFHELEFEEQMQMVQVNVQQLTALCHYFLPDMVRRGKGSVLNVASTAAFQPGPFMAVYYATKAYVLSFSQALHGELQGTGVTVTALCPGPTQSEFFERAKMDDSKLSKWLLIPSSLEVAKYGHRAMLRGQSVAIEGLLNRLLVEVQRFFPRPLIVWMTKQVMKRR